MPLATSSSVVERIDQETFELRRLRSQPRLIQGLTYLAERDRVLVEMSIKHGMSRRHMGMVLGLTAGTVTRKLRNVLNRLDEPIVRSLTSPDCSLPPDLRGIGIRYFLHKTPISLLARESRMSLYEIRKNIEHIRGWHRGVM